MGKRKKRKPIVTTKEYWGLRKANGEVAEWPNCFSPEDVKRVAPAHMLEHGTPVLLTRVVTTRYHFKGF